MIHLVVDKAQKSDYKTLVSLTNSAKDIKTIERFFSARLVRGAILLGYETGSEAIKRLAAGFTSYYSRIQYQAYEVTDLLSPAV